MRVHFVVSVAVVSNTPGSQKLMRRYQTLLERGEILPDRQQQQAVTVLAQLSQALAGRFWLRKNPQGVYLWGDVGRGKTMLMDLFVESCPAHKVLRLHFHHFMAWVHGELKHYQGQENPLLLLAKKLSKKTRVLCFDEFFVADIGDAMLLGRLLQYLFDYRVILVATSNSQPRRLYWQGLQRQRFLPVISALENHTNVINLNGELDYRERCLPLAQSYFVLPKTKQQRLALQSQLQQKLGLPLTTVNTGVLEIMGRDIPYLSRNRNCIGFEFSSLCMGPRSHFDYMALAKTVDSLLIVNIPALGGQVREQLKARGTEDGSFAVTSTGDRQVLLANTDDAARRFIALVDECYEVKLKLFITSEVALSQLYESGALLFEFQRARSRLLEMATKQYQLIEA